jgi:hypothetical protein
MKYLQILYSRMMSQLISAVDCKISEKCDRLEKQINVLETKIDRNAILSARHLINGIQRMGVINSLDEVEFKVFSQWGEDGILQYLISHIPISQRIFIEFGVEDYSESNTRFLLLNNNWEGLVIDANPKLESVLRGKELYWRYNLTAKSSFITAENINNIIETSGLNGDIGLLSIDIDGNDYWVWKAIDVISPRIVVCEYNSVFGSKYEITTPYRGDFEKTKYHHSNLCFGASLAAICRLAEEKGYDFVGSNSEGCNAFFVRKDISNGLPKPTVKAGYSKSKFRSSIDKGGSLTFLSGNARLDAIKHAEVFDLDAGRLVKIESLGEL